MNLRHALREVAGVAGPVGFCCGQRRGIALLVVLLAMLTVEIAVAAALYVVTLEEVASRASFLRERARLAAESGIAIGLAQWDAVAHALLPLLTPTRLGVGAAPDGADFEIWLERLDDSRFHLVARGVVDGASGTEATADASAIVSTLPPHRIAADFGAAITAGDDVQLGPASRITGAAAAALATCPPPADSLLSAVIVLPAPAIELPPTAALSTSPPALIAGVPPVSSTTTSTDSAALERVAGVPLTALAALADRVETGSLTLAPAVAGAACDTAAPGNWGAPLSVGHPCAGFAPLVFAPGDLTLVSGSGQGLLLVTGNLVIDSAAAFHGGVVVLGDADVRGTITGALRVRGKATIGGTVNHDPCLLWRAATGSPALRRPLRTERWRLAVP